jgi:retron-type reverse transcriptase
MGIAVMLLTPSSIRTLQRKLYRKAKQEPSFRFYSLYDKVHRADILNHAWRLVRSNRGSAGVDGATFEDIEENEGKDTFLAELQEALKSKTYKPEPVKRVMIPKPDGSKRPLGIPTIRDRVAQMAVKMVIEPIFEADFCDNSYGFRPKRSAHGAVDDITRTLRQGHTKVIDADLSKYFDSISHSNLMAVVAERICDKAILHIIRQWLKAPVVETDENGKRKYTGGKGSSKGTPQGGVMTPRTQKATLSLFAQLNIIGTKNILTSDIKGFIDMTHGQIFQLRTSETHQFCTCIYQSTRYYCKSGISDDRSIWHLETSSLPVYSGSQDDQKRCANSRYKNCFYRQAVPKFDSSSSTTCQGHRKNIKRNRNTVLGGVSPKWTKAWLKEIKLQEKYSWNIVLTDYQPRKFLKHIIVWFQTRLGQQVFQKTV